MAKNRLNMFDWLDRILHGPEKKIGDGVDIVPQVRLHRLLFLLLPALEAAGFQSSPDRIIRLKKLLALLPSETDGATLSLALCPIFAIDPKQQADFFVLFKQLYEQILEEVEDEKAAVRKKKTGKIADIHESDSTSTHSSVTEKLAEDLTDLGKSSNIDVPPPSPSLPSTTSHRPLVVELDQCTDPPYTWSIVPDDEEVTVETGGTFGQTLLRLRRREASDTEILDIAATVEATIENGGRAELRYRRHTRPTEYLLLVERFSAEDHRAGLFDYFFQILRANEVLVERFFYQGDLRICRNEKYPAGLGLLQLRYRYPDSRLLVVGTGYCLLSPATGALADWIEPIRTWRIRVLLTPVARAAWGQREQKLAEVFSLLPASLQSLHFVAESPEEVAAGQFDALPEYIRRIAETQPLVLDEPVLRRLRQHFDPGLLAWIAACAVYPALHFDLTLRLGRLTSESLGYNMVTAANILALARLPWFTAGHILPEVRSELVGFLEARHPALHSLVIEYLHSLLERNPPPENSVAWAEHRINIALLAALRDEQRDASLLNELRAVVKRMDRPERRGDFVLPRAWEKLLEGFGLEDIQIPTEINNEPDFINFDVLQFSKTRFRMTIKKENYCFVIMPLNLEMQAVYDDVIKPSIQEAGLICIRSDEVIGTDNIRFRNTLEGICQAKVVVVDLTGTNANVLYELGIAHCLGNNVILITQDTIPFALTHYRVIQYQDTISGGRRLAKQLIEIVKTFEEWTKVPNSPVQDFLPDVDSIIVSVHEYKELQNSLAIARNQLSEANNKIRLMEKS